MEADSLFRKYRAAPDRSAVVHSGCGFARLSWPRISSCAAAVPLRVCRRHICGSARDSPKSVRDSGTVRVAERGRSMERSRVGPSEVNPRLAFAQFPRVRIRARQLPTFDYERANASFPTEDRLCNTHRLAGQLQV